MNLAVQSELESVLWVDDRPRLNEVEVQAFRAVGLKITQVQTTQNALDVLGATKFAAVISDMARREGGEEGNRLLDAIRNGGDSTPLFFYIASVSHEQEQAALARGAQGVTDSMAGLLEMVVGSLANRARTKQLSGQIDS